MNSQQEERLEMKPGKLNPCGYRKTPLYAGWWLGNRSNPCIQVLLCLGISVENRALLLGPTSVNICEAKWACGGQYDGSSILALDVSNHSSSVALTEIPG